MKVILLDYVYKQGVAGEVIDVADGFARNYLIPKKLAVHATPGELKRAAKLREQAVVRRAALENRMNELAREIDGVELVFGRRAAATGKLFGSVTTQEIADALLEKTGVDINRRRISQQPLREVGTHEVPVRLGSEISPNVKITIVREDEVAEYLASLERGETEEAPVEVEQTVNPKAYAEEVAAANTPEPVEAKASEPVPIRPDDDKLEPVGEVEEMETEILPADQVKEMVEEIRSQETGNEDR